MRLARATGCAPHTRRTLRSRGMAGTRGCTGWGTLPSRLRARLQPPPPPPRLFPGRQVVTARDIREIEVELREILGDAEADAIMLKIAQEDELGGSIPQDELATLMSRIVESREKLEREMRQQQAVDLTRQLPEEIEAKDPAFALRVSAAKAARDKIEQIELNQKNLFDSIHSSQKAVMLKISSLTDTMEMIGSKLATLKAVQRR